MALTWDADWKAAKKFFEDTTKKKKPNVTVMGIFSKHSSGLDSGVKKAMADWKKAEAAYPITQKDVDTFKSSADNFAKSANSYINTLELAIKKEITDKGDKTEYSKGCKYLAKELDSIMASMNNQVDWLNGKVKGLKLAEIMAENLAKTIVSCAAKCYSAIAKVKAKPSVKLFNDEIFTPARDLSQQIGNVGVLRKKGHVIPEKYDEKTAQTLYDIIRPFGDDRLTKKLKPDAAPADILKELKILSQAAKAAEAYAKK